MLLKRNNLLSSITFDLADVNCFGYDCYPLAFGVPAILMVLSLVLFVAGSRLYRKVPPEGNVVVRVCSAVWVRHNSQFCVFHVKAACLA